MTFKESLAVAAISSLIPALLAGGISLTTFFSVSDLEEKIKNIESDTKRIELYNLLSPNALVKLNGQYFNATFGSAILEGGNKLELANALNKDEFKYTNAVSYREYIDKIKKLLTKYNQDPIDIEEIVSFNYCVTNNGNVEHYFHEPEIELYQNEVHRLNVTKAKSFKSEPIKVVPVGQSACNRINILYSDIPEGKFVYKLRLMVEPALRTLKFIYPYKPENDLNQLKQQFSFTYEIESSGENTIDKGWLH